MGFRRMRAGGRWERGKRGDRCGSSAESVVVLLCLYFLEVSVPSSEHGGGHGVCDIACRHARPSGGRRTSEEDGGGVPSRPHVVLRHMPRANYGRMGVSKETPRLLSN